jgi:hypothetical protein
MNTKALLDKNNKKSSPERFEMTSKRAVAQTTFRWP